MYTPALLFTSAALYRIEQTGSAEFPLVDAVDPIVTEKDWALFIQTSNDLLLVRDTTYSHILPLQSGNSLDNRCSSDPFGQ
jgi:hypothetical protein